MNATAIKLVIKFWQDDQMEDPCDTDGWKAYSFATTHGNFKDPEDFEEDAVLGKKLKVGLAFPLSYYEHGQCLWALGGELPPSAQCLFDSVGFAGLLIWEQEEDNLGAYTKEKRREDAAAFIERYTQWCNGEIYGYTIEAFRKCPTCGQDDDAEADVDFDLPSCGGYYPDSIDGMIVDIKDNIGDDWRDYEVEFQEQDGYGLAEKVRELWKREA